MQLRHNGFSQSTHKNAVPRKALPLPLKFDTSWT